MDKIEAEARLNEVDMILNTTCKCDTCFNQRVYLEKRFNDLTKKVNELRSIGHEYTGSDISCNG